MTQPPVDRPALLITHRMTPPVEARAMRDYDTTIHQAEAVMSPQQLIQAAAGKQALMVFPADRVGREVIWDLDQSVRVIATFSVGHDHIDLQAARDRGILVANTPGVIAIATAEIALLLILNAARRAREGLDLALSGTWAGLRPTQLLGIEVHGKTLGILGMGDIGREVAQRARAFGLSIAYHNRRRLPPEQELGATYCPTPEELFELSDILSVNCPLTPDTHHLVDADRLARMRRGSILVNTARGPVVKDEDVIAALHSGQLSAVGLDVYEQEPTIAQAYQEAPNAFLMPHLGTATRETRTVMGMRCLDNLDAVFRGEIPASAL